ncbi:SHOCT domain-containing protein, partial [Halobium palmae]
MTDDRRVRPDGYGDEDDEETPLEQVVAGVVIATIFLVGFGLLALGFPWFWVAFPVGFAGVLPAAIGLVRWYESRRESEGAR